MALVQELKSSALAAKYRNNASIRPWPILSRLFPILQSC